MERNTQLVDVSRMFETPKCAVMCRTIEDARLLYHSVITQFHDYCSWSPEDLEYVWNANESKTGFSMFAMWDDKPEPLSYCDEAWFRAEGYVIIEFSDLSDIPDLEEGDLPIGFLLGGVSCR